MGNKTRKISLAVTACLISATSLFAADTYESGLLFNTNEFVDKSDEYIATTRTAVVTYTSAADQVVDTQEAEATYTIKNYGNTDERAVSGDAEAFDLLDTFYDGYVMTPFNDSVLGYEKSKTGQETIDGVLCDIYKFQVKLDMASLTGETSWSRIAGWDNDDADYNGDVAMTVWVDSSTGAIVKQEAVYKAQNGKPDSNIYDTATQTAYFDTITIEDGTVINVPAEVVTEGKSRRSSGTAVSDSCKWSAVETFSGYAFLSDWRG